MPAVAEGSSDTTSGLHQAIRERAEANGQEVVARGRIKQDLLDAYQAAQN